MNYKIIAFQLNRYREPLSITTQPSRQQENTLISISPETYITINTPPERHFLTRHPLAANLCIMACNAAAWGIATDASINLDPDNPNTTLLLGSNTLVILYYVLNQKQFPPCAKDHLILDNAPNRALVYIAIAPAIKSSIHLLNKSVHQGVTAPIMLLGAPLILTHIFRSQPVIGKNGKTLPTHPRWIFTLTPFIQPLQTLNEEHPVLKYAIKSIIGGGIAILLNKTTHSDDTTPFSIAVLGPVILTSLEVITTSLMDITNQLDLSEGGENTTYFSLTDLSPISTLPKTDLLENEIPEYVLLAVIYTTIMIAFIVENNPELGHLWLIYISALSILNFTIKPILKLGKNCGLHFPEHYNSLMKNHQAIKEDPLPRRTGSLKSEI